MASSEGFRNEKRETVLRTLWGGRATLELLETAQMSPARGGNDSVRESIWFPGGEWGGSGICMLQGGERGGSGVCMLQGGEQGGSESLYGPREVSGEGQRVCMLLGGEWGGSESLEGSREGMLVSGEGWHPNFALQGG